MLATTAELHLFQRLLQYQVVSAPSVSTLESQHCASRNVQAFLDMIWAEIICTSRVEAKFSQAFNAGCSRGSDELTDD